MRRYLIQVLKVAGLYNKLVSFNTSTKKDRHKSKAMNKDIEFIGPSGVGKSTLFSEVKKYTVGNWFYKEDISNILLGHGDGEVDDHYHWRLLFAKSRYLEDYKANGYEKIKLMKYFSEVILGDLVTFEGVSEKRLFLDEGLCHNFSKELMEFSDSDLAALMAKRALIFVQARDTLTIVKQIRKREIELGHKIAYHVGLNDNELINMAEASALSLEILVKRVKPFGVPVCIIFTEDDIHLNVKRVLEFESQFIHAAEDATAQ